MTFQKTAALLLSLSAASLLVACGGASDTAADTEPKAALETAAQANGNGSVTLCPADKILASPKAYKSAALPEMGDDKAAWHAENANREGVKTTVSGLQYKTVQAGLKNGASPVGGEIVTVHYHGYFPDGDVFDSSYKRGSPSKFPANRVIAGWVESLQDMKTCEARTLYIPGDLAYGPKGRSSIPPNATLLFNVQLIGVNKK